MSLHLLLSLSRISILLVSICCLSISILSFALAISSSSFFYNILFFSLAFFASPFNFITQFLDHVVLRIINFLTWSMEPEETTFIFQSILLLADKPSALPAAIFGIGNSSIEVIYFLIF